MSIFFLLRILKSICDMYINHETVFSISARVCARQYFYLCTTPHLDVRDFKKAYFLNFYFFSGRSVGYTFLCLGYKHSKWIRDLGSPFSL